MVELARLANGGEVESLERRPPVPIRQSHRDPADAAAPATRPGCATPCAAPSAWALAVLVVNITGVEHGFWVLLGVISILRFDAVGTRRFALQAVVGTIVGVGRRPWSSSFLVDRPWVLWVLLPTTSSSRRGRPRPSTTPSARPPSPRSSSSPSPSWSWPPQLSTGLIRIEDIALGAAVALVVGLLMWPRGAVGYLRRELAEAIRAAGAYMSAALGSFAGPIARRGAGRLRPHAVGDRRESERDLRHRAHAAWPRRGPAPVDQRDGDRLPAHLRRSRRRPLRRDDTDDHLASGLQAIAERPPAQRGPLDGGRRCRRGEGQDPSSPAPPPRRGLPALPRSRAGDARDLIIAVWVADWVRHLDRLSTGHLAGSGTGIIGSFRGCSSMAEHQLPKLTVRVRFSSPARMTMAPTFFGGLCHPHPLP